jgi:hypothetical protein
LVIVALRRDGASRLEGAATQGPYVDVNMDGFVTAFDALAVIQQLRSADGEGGEGEGGYAAVSDVKDDLLTATTPPAGDSTLSSSVLVTGLISDSTAETGTTAENPVDSLAVSESSSSTDTINFGLFDSEAVAEVSESWGSNALLDTPSQDEVLESTLEELVLVSQDGAHAVDEVFRRMGEL